MPSDQVFQLLVVTGLVWAYAEYFYPWSKRVFGNTLTLCLHPSKPFIVVEIDSEKRTVSIAYGGITEDVEFELIRKAIDKSQKEIQEEQKHVRME